MATAALISTALVMGCIIIPDPPELKPPDPPPIEPPPPFVPVPFPVAGGEGMNIAAVWFVRTDPGTSTLATAYGQMLAQSRSAFEASGAHLSSVTVFALQDGTPLWATSVLDGGGPPVSIEDTLRFHAAHPWDAGQVTCPAQIPAARLWDLSRVQVTYPEALVPFIQPEPVQLFIELEDGGFEDGGFVDGGDPYPHSLRPIPPDVNAVFVGIVDSAPRPFSYYQSDCAPGLEPAAEFYAGRKPLTWVRNQSERFDAPQLAWALIGTAEDGGSSAMKAACLKHASFPRPALDVISASERALYTPWSEHAVSFPSTVQSFDFCEAAAGQWQFGKFVNNWALNLTQWSTPQ